jgi:hypothetical protein
VTVTSHITGRVHRDDLLAARFGDYGHVLVGILVLVRAVLPPDGIVVLDHLVDQEQVDGRVLVPALVGRRLGEEVIFGRVPGPAAAVAAAGPAEVST